MTPENYSARPQRVIIFLVIVWDSNCPRHIPRKLDAAVDARLRVMQERIDVLTRRNFDLEAEIARLERRKPSEAG